MDFNIDSLETVGAILAYLTLKDPSIEFGKMLQDCIHTLHMYINSILDKYNKICTERNITSKNSREIEPKFAILWYQSAMLEENNILQELWATLLANATDKNFNGAIKITFIEILKTLTPIEVSILKEYQNFLKRNNYWDSPEKIISIKLDIDQQNLMKKFNIGELKIKASILNLERCKLITTLQAQNKIFVHGEPLIQKSSPCLTELGILFIKACIS